jgi:hypothetical protein
MNSRGRQSAKVSATKGTEVTPVVDTHETSLTNPMDAAMEAIPMVGDPEVYRQRLADFKTGWTHAMNESRDGLASKLIDAWCADKGKQIAWAKAVQIVAIVTKQSDAERDRLLKMDDE